MGVRVLSYLRPGYSNYLRRAAMGMTVVRGVVAVSSRTGSTGCGNHLGVTASASFRGQRAAAQAVSRHGGVLVGASARQYATCACVYPSSSLGMAAHSFSGRGISIKAPAFAADDGLQEKEEDLAVDDVEPEALNFAEDGAEESAFAATSSPADNGVDPCKVWVGNLPWEVEVEDLRNLGEEFGAVVDVTIVRDRMTGRSRGFGFLEYSEPQEATNAINTLNGQEFSGRVLNVNSPLPRGAARERPRRRDFNNSYRLYVGNLAWSIRENELETLFGDFGPTNTYIVMDGDRSKGFGFVSFANEEDRNSAMSSLDGMEVEGRPLRVSVAYDRDRKSRSSNEYGGYGGGYGDDFDDLNKF